MRFVSILTAAFLGFTGPALAQQPAPVRVDDVRLEPVQQLRLVTGNVRAITRSRVAAIEPGRIVEFDVHEGQMVDAGQRLAVIDASRLQLQLRQMEADLSVGEALLAERVSQVELRESDVQMLQTMQERGAVNPKELSDARLELSVAQARRDQAERELLVKQAEADLLQQRIDDTVITAPFDGMVISRLAERGEWVAEGGSIVELASTGSFDVWLDVPQRLARAVSRKNFSVMVHVDALDRTFESQATRIVGDVDAASRTFALVARIERPIELPVASEHSPELTTGMPQLAPGMSVIAWIPMEDVFQQMTVHKDAVLRNDVGAYVLVVREGDGSGPQAAVAPVDVMFALEERFVVRSDNLMPGDRAVIEGGERLRPGTAVRVVDQLPEQLSVDSSQLPVPSNTPPLTTDHRQLATGTSQ